MRRLGKKLFFYYCALFAFLIVISAVALNIQSRSWIFQLIFLPVPLYFLILIVSGIFKKRKNAEQSSTSTIGFFTILFIFVILLGLGLYNTLTTKEREENIQQKTEAEQAIIQTSPPADLLQDATAFKIIVKADFEESLVNVRSEPSVSSEVITQVRSGQVFPVLSQEEGWYEIKLESSSTGWINEELVEIVEDN